MDVEDEVHVVKSLNDRRNYRVIQLDNGLTALLISDVTSKNERKKQSDNKCIEGDLQTTCVGTSCDKCSKMIIDHDEDVYSQNDMKDDDDDVSSNDDNNSSDDDDDSYNNSESDDVASISYLGNEDEENNHCKTKNVNTETKLAAAALCVGVGSFSDPKELPGLAHFLEHMVFMGSKRYPDENSFDAFIKKHGGSTNAFTDCERTVFKFDVRPKYFKDTLDRFAQFFISPLMKKNSIEREIMAVDNEFKMSYQDDQARKIQLLGSLTTDDHPFGKFLWGSEESLGTNPKKLGIDVNEYLRSFWEIMYSSHCMTLALISNESLDILEEWVREIFTLIPKCDSARPNFQDSKYKFDIHKFQKLYKVVPVKDINQLEVTWAFPCLHKYYRTKPMDYISWLVGHEGHGSVLALLKKKGWATSLCCGNGGSGQEFNTIFSLFICTVNLTADGLEHYLECITIIFQYLEMLRQQRPQFRIFSEIKRIGDNNFRFEEEIDPSEYVEEVAECMQLYPEKDYLTGNDLMWDFDEKIINDIQNNLTPEKANIMLISKTLSNECTETEKWFGTRYSSQDIDHKLKDFWKDLKLHSELHLPEENAFIATNFDIIPCEQTLGKFPVVVHDSAMGKVWHKQDNTFLVPKASYYFHLKSPVINGSAQKIVVAEVYAVLLQFDLKDVTYAADVAELSYDISVKETGIVLSFAGFNDKLPLLFQKVVEHMVKFVADEVQFNMVKEQLTRVYYNRIIKPQALLRSTRLQLLQQVKWTDMDKRATVSNITLDDLKDFMSEFKLALYVESLFQGNITEQDAVAHQDFLYRNLAFEPLPEALHPQIKVMQLPNCESICKIEGYNKKDQNTVITNYYQIGPASGKDLTFTNLLMDIMEEPCFDILRTQQQLGYSVYCTCRETFGILGFSLTLHTQAEKYSSYYVKDRMDVFLKDFLEKLQSVDSEVFQSHVSSMIEIKKHEDLNLAEEVNRNWQEITDGTYVFDRLNKEVEYLELLNKDIFLGWVKEIGSELNTKKLSVQVLGHKREEDNDITDETDGICNGPQETWTLSLLAEPANQSQSILDIRIFKQSLSVYPVSKIY